MFADDWFVGYLKYTVIEYIVVKAAFSFTTPHNSLNQTEVTITQHGNIIVTQRWFKIKLIFCSLKFSLKF